MSLKGTGVLLPPDTVRVEVASVGSDGAANCWQLQAVAQSVRVGGRAVSCDIWKSWSVPTDGKPRDERTVWLSLDVPGWLVKGPEARLADFQTLDAAREHGGQPISRGPWAGVRTGGWVLYEDGRLLRAAAVNSLGLPAIEELLRSEAGGWKTVRTEVLFPTEPYTERPFQVVDSYRATMETEGGPLKCTVQTYRGLDDAARTAYRTTRVWTCPEVPGRTVRARDDQSEAARCQVKDFESSGLRPLPETEKK